MLGRVGILLVMSACVLELLGWGVGIAGRASVFGFGLHSALVHVDDLLGLFHIRIGIVTISSLCLTLGAGKWSL